MKIAFGIEYDGGDIDFTLQTNLFTGLDRAFWMTAAGTALMGVTYLNIT